MFTPRDEQMCGPVIIDFGCLEKQKLMQMKKNYYSFVSGSGIP